MKNLTNFIAAILLFAASFSIPVRAQEGSTFYSNISPSSYRTYTYYSASNEYADDVPFFGTQHITAFTYAYRAAATANITIRYYTIDPATGNPGVIIAQFRDENLPAGDHLRTFQIPIEQQFDFTATPNLFGVSNRFGGFVSFQFDNASGNQILREAQGASNRGFFDVTQGIFIGQTDVLGVTPASFYLQLSGIGDTTANTPPSISTMTLDQRSVQGGTTVEGRVTLDRPAPAGGTIVQLVSSNRLTAAPTPADITVPAGETTATFLIYTAKPGSRKTTVTISARVGESSKTIGLEVRRSQEK